VVSLSLSLSLSVTSEAHRRGGRRCLSLSEDPGVRYGSPFLVPFNVLQQDVPIIPFRGRPVETYQREREEYNNFEEGQRG